MNLETLQKAKELEFELLELKQKLELFKRAKDISEHISLYDSNGKYLLKIKLWKEEEDLIISNRIKFSEENISRLEHELKIL